MVSELIPSAFATCTVEYVFIWIIGHHTRFVKKKNHIKKGLLPIASIWIDVKNIPFRILCEDCLVCLSYVFSFSNRSILRVSRMRKRLVCSLNGNGTRR